MSQHKHKLSKTLTLIFVSLAVACSLAGCRDELLYSSTEIPDGIVDIEAEVIFRPLMKTEIQTRAEAPSGASYKDIKSLHIFFFDEKGELITEYSGLLDSSKYTVTDPEGTTSDKHAKFNLRIRTGNYKAYAVANTSFTDDEGKDVLSSIQSIDDLKKFKLKWDDDIDKDLEMFGVFKDATSGISGSDNGTFESDSESLKILPSTRKIHSWVRRATSKVTIDFNGAGLKDGVTVYIKTAELKDMASGALLGDNSWVGTPADQTRDQIDHGFTCLPDNREKKYVITYGTGDKTGPNVTNSHTNILPSEVWEGSELQSFHNEAAPALPCYENMQGVGDTNQKHQDKDKDGIIDSYTKDGVPNGTYLEVTGYYVSDRPEYKSEGEIIYRFMLGKDADKDFDLIRNHHYQITMNFKDYGNDIDWHIVYKNLYLDASYPKDINYQGKFFDPDGDLSDSGYLPNAGHHFDNQNKIIVTSYESDNKSKDWMEPTITYTYSKVVNGSWVQVQEPAQGASNPDYGWLTTTKDEVAKDGKKTYKFVALMSNPIVQDMNVELGKEANAGSGDLRKNNESANCYIVNGKGSYSLPLIYGNGNIPTGNHHFVNYLGVPISNANIKDDLEAFNTNHSETKGYTVDLSDLTAQVIWQDAEDLITNVKIDGNNIKFDVGKSAKGIKQGNAVIALIDPNVPEPLDDDYVKHTDIHNNIHTNTHAVWSWHIWVTRFGSDDFEQNIRLSNHDGDEYDVMPVHLGWCSDESVIYFPRRKCDIKFQLGDQEITRTIVQYPHFALTRGDHPYYQWGRKDPFVGTKIPWGNKPRWEFGEAKTDWNGHNPYRIYNEPTNFGSKYDMRRTTQQCYHELIKNPEKWHNAPRTSIDKEIIEGEPGYDDWVAGEGVAGSNYNNWYTNASGFYSNNDSFADLWDYMSEKTIYDPCPPGYRVESEEVFSGFTVSGNNESESIKLYDVLEDNMLSDYTVNGEEKTFSFSGGVNANVIEFYTDTKKLQSIPFPVSGYRDYDDMATVYDLGSVGYAWTNNARTKSHSHNSLTKLGKPFTVDVEGTCAYHLKFNRSGTSEEWKSRTVLVAPREDFYNTDGFAVRPVAKELMPSPMDGVQSEQPENPAAQQARHRARSR